MTDLPMARTLVETIEDAIVGHDAHDGDTGPKGTAYAIEKEVVGWFRTILERDLDWMEKSLAGSDLDAGQRAGYEKAIRMLRYRTLGNETGCVVTAFDRRGPDLRSQARWIGEQ